MPGSYSKRPAKKSKRVGGDVDHRLLSDRELLRRAHQSAQAHVRNQARADRLAAADRDNRRNQP